MFEFLLNPKPELLTIQREEAPDFGEEYNRLAAKVGILARAQTQAVTIPRILAEEAIHVYDLARVEKYMDKKGYWDWYFLRPQDDGKLLPRRKTFTSRPNVYGAYHFFGYKEPVPFPVLLTVDKIVERVGSEAMFFVAALSYDPDPFLAVMSRYDWTRTMYVIERWDEPSFR
jgi:hypothetical protein